MKSSVINCITNRKFKSEHDFLLRDMKFINLSNNKTYSISCDDNIVIRINKFSILYDDDILHRLFVGNYGHISDIYYTYCYEKYNNKIKLTNYQDYENYNRIYIFKCSNYNELLDNMINHKKINKEWIFISDDEYCSYKYILVKIL